MTSTMTSLKREQRTSGTADLSRRIQSASWGLRMAHFEMDRAESEAAYTEAAPPVSSRSGWRSCGSSCSSGWPRTTPAPRSGAFTSGGPGVRIETLPHVQEPRP